MLFDEVSHFLSGHGMRLNTDVGQHFLIDEGTLKLIVGATNIMPTDHVVEIGPGIGILTRELLQQAQHVTAIEFDARMIPLLKQFIGLSDSPKSLRSSMKNLAEPGSSGTSGMQEKLTLIHGNALHTHMPAIPYTVVANIPYHITSPLLRHLLLESPIRPTTLTLLIQKEVAENIAGKDAGMLTVLVNLFGTPTIVTKVRPEAFLPPPAVDSAVLHIDCSGRPKADRPTIDAVLQLAKIAFAKKRKMLRNSIGTLPKGIDALAQCAIDPKRRPETLSIDEWIALAKFIGA